VEVPCQPNTVFINVLGIFEQDPSFILDKSVEGLTGDLFRKLILSESYQDTWLNEEAGLMTHLSGAGMNCSAASYGVSRI
jgi:hypothetical protein